MVDHRTAAASEGPLVLVVEDEPLIAELLGALLRHEGFRVVSAATGADAIDLARRSAPDLVLLDIQLPDMDGFAVQAALRSSGRSDGAPAPVIFLTARDAATDKVRGLTDGADDYVTKPFDSEELIARVRAVLRRTGTGSDASVGSVLRFADLSMDEGSRDIRRGDRRIDLTPTEHNLLHFLLSNPRQVLTRAQILDHVWGYDFEGEASVVDTYIFYLRRKVDAGSSPLIHTVRGVGYCLREGG